MRIEEEIKQEKFASEQLKAAINIMFTSGWLYAKQNAALKPFDLSVQQFNILRILKGSQPEPLSIKTITSRMIDRMSNTSRLIEKLRTKKLVERKACPHDRRQVDVCITQYGLEVLVKASEEMKQNMEHLVKLPVNEATKLNQLLDNFRDDV
jgi:DNA-binding MarR family transcriptional regulator